MMFETKTDQIEQYIRIKSLVQTRVDSEFTNPDPIQNNCTNNHKTKINIKTKSKNTIKKSKYVAKCVFWEQGVTIT